MTQDLIPQTPRFDDDLERALRSLAASPPRSGVPRPPAMIALAVALIVVVALAALGLGRDGRPDRLVTGDRPPSSTAPSSTRPSTSAPAATAAAGTAVVPGRPGGAPPCAPRGDGEYGADVAHPQRAPLQAVARFGGVIWAFCGADTALSGDVLNLRSSDGGATWMVNRTPISINPAHAGDDVRFQVRDGMVGEVHVVSLVAERDDRYATDDGGLTWQLLP